MLRVKTYLDKSPVHGIGIFAGEDIAAGTMIWEFNPLVDLEFSPDRWEEMRRTVCPASFREIEKYAYKEKNRIVVCLDNAQFMNHDEKAYNVANSPDGNAMTARGPIAAGQELLCNYFDYCDADDINLAKIKRSSC